MKILFHYREFIELLQQSDVSRNIFLYVRRGICFTYSVWSIRVVFVLEGVQSSRRKSFE